MPDDSISMARPVLVVIGPSASGKSTAVRELHRRGVVRVHPTWTTRERRPDEHHGALEHRFVTDEMFDTLEAGGFFLGTVSLPGLSFRYALPHPRLADHGPVDTIMARAPFIRLFAEFFPHRVVYQIEDTRERAHARLLTRKTSPHEVEARLVGHDDEVAAGRAIADRVFVNDGDLDALVAKLTFAVYTDFVAQVVPA